MGGKMEHITNLIHQKWDEDKRRLCRRGSRWLKTKKKGIEKRAEEEKQVYKWTYILFCSFTLIPSCVIHIYIQYILQYVYYLHGSYFSICEWSWMAGVALCYCSGHIWLKKHSKTVNFVKNLYNTSDFGNFLWYEKG